MMRELTVNLSPGEAAVLVGLLGRAARAQAAHGRLANANFYRALADHIALETLCEPKHVCDEFCQVCEERPGL